MNRSGGGSAVVREDDMATVHRIPPQRSDADLFRSIRDGDVRAQAALYDRYAAHVRRIAIRTLGPDEELMDVVQESFLQVLASIDSVKSPELLKAWITRVTVNTVRSWIRRRQRRWWLTFLDPAGMPEVEYSAPYEHDPAVRRTYEILASLSPEDRIVFGLRYFEGLELTEVADACGVSLATIKRRIRRAKTRFEQHAAADPFLAQYVERS